MADGAHKTESESRRRQLLVLLRYGVASGGRRRIWSQPPRRLDYGLWPKLMLGCVIVIGALALLGIVNEYFL